MYELWQIDTEFGHLWRRIARGNPCARGRLFDNPTRVNRVGIFPLALAPLAECCIAENED